MRQTLLRLAALTVVALAVVPASASAALTASNVRIGAQSAYVRVVVDFTGGTIKLNEAEALDALPANGDASVQLAHAGVVVHSRDVTASGVRARLGLASAGKARIQLKVTPGKFKYVRITALPAPQRLVVDLYRTAPPSSAGEIMNGVNGCLKLTTVQGTGTSFRVKGIEHNVFEGSFVIRIRDASGKVVGREVMTARGAWSQLVTYHVPTAQSGTVEAVAASAKDGSLACLVQVRVALRP